MLQPTHFHVKRIVYTRKRKMPAVSYWHWRPRGLSFLLWSIESDVFCVVIRFYFILNAYIFTLSRWNAAITLFRSQDYYSSEKCSPSQRRRVT